MEDARLVKNHRLLPHSHALGRSLHGDLPDFLKDLPRDVRHNVKGSAICALARARCRPRNASRRRPDLHHNTEKRSQASLMCGTELLLLVLPPNFHDFLHESTTGLFDHLLHATYTVPLLNREEFSGLLPGCVISLLLRQTSTICSNFDALLRH